MVGFVFGGAPCRPDCQRGDADLAGSSGLCLDSRNPQRATDRGLETGDRRGPFGGRSNLLVGDREGRGASPGYQTC